MKNNPFQNAERELAEQNARMAAEKARRRAETALRLVNLFEVLHDHHEELAQRGFKVRRAVRRITGEAVALLQSGSHYYVISLTGEEHRVAGFRAEGDGVTTFIGETVEQAIDAIARAVVGATFLVSPLSKNQVRQQFDI